MSSKDSIFRNDAVIIKTGTSLTAGALTAVGTVKYSQHGKWVTGFLTMNTFTMTADAVSINLPVHLPPSAAESTFFFWNNMDGAGTMKIGTGVVDSTGAIVIYPDALNIATGKWANATTPCIGNPVARTPIPFVYLAA